MADDGLAIGATSSVGTTKVGNPETTIRPVPPVKQDGIGIYSKQVALNWNPSIWGSAQNTGSHTTTGFQALNIDTFESRANV